MAKDKRKKKYFQGLEHLRPQIESAQTGQVIREDEFLPSAKFLKSDLIKVMILVISFLVILAGLTVLDKNTDILTKTATKITSLIIK